MHARTDRRPQPDRMHPDPDRRVFHGVLVERNANERQRDPIAGMAAAIEDGAAPITRHVRQ